MTRLKQIILSCMVCCVCVSCVSTKSIVYFQPISSKMDRMVTEIKAAYIPVIMPGDILSVTVNGLDNDDSEIFNPHPAILTHQAQIGGFVVLEPIKGFMVDQTGHIDFPQIGKIHVAGQSAKEVEVLITEQLQQYIKSPTVSVHIANYIISILGEVARPAQYVISHNRISLPEALALAGDLTVYGKRNNILVIREIAGERHFARIDLTKRDLFDSPYYYMHSGDIVYVEPAKGKLTSSDRTFQLTPIIISSLSLLLLIVNTILK